MANSEWWSTVKKGTIKAWAEVREIHRRSRAENPVIVPYKRMFRVGLLLAAITAILLAVYAVFGGSVPSFWEFPDFQGGTFDLGLEVSLWWLVLYTWLFGAFAAYFFSQKNMGINAKEIAQAVLVAPFLVIPGILFGYVVGKADCFLFDTIGFYPPNGLIVVVTSISVIAGCILINVFGLIDLFTFEKKKFGQVVVLYSSILFLFMGYAGGVQYSLLPLHDLANGLGLFSALLVPGFLFIAFIPILFFWLMAALFLVIGPAVVVLIFFFKGVKVLFSWAIK